MADERQSGVAGKHQAAIVPLCEGYSIASEYASFIVLENDSEYRRWKIDRRNATNTGTLGASANWTINGGSIISSPLSTDGQGLLLGGSNGNGIRVPNVFGWGGEFTISLLARLDNPQQNQQSVLLDDFGRPGVLLGVSTDTGQLRFTIVTLDNGVETDTMLLSPDPFPIGE